MSSVVANCSSWFMEEDLAAEVPGEDFHFVANPDALTTTLLEKLKPRYVFFPHWSWKVPAEIFDRWECVVFHVAPLPFGRGGSPIQNLIERGFQEAPFNALRMEAELDAGPIYFSRNVSLAGTLADIFARLSPLAVEMISKILACEPEPAPQVGEPLVFRRRSPEQSEILAGEELENVFDKIRMVDFAEYPRAFVRLGNGKVEFSNARIKDGELRADAVFRLSDV